MQIWSVYSDLVKGIRFNFLKEDFGRRILNFVVEKLVGLLKTMEVTVDSLIASMSFFCKNCGLS